MSEINALDTYTSPSDELDLLAAILTGANPLDIDITAEEFDEPRCAAVWRAACAVAETGGNVNPSTVRIALGPDGDRASVWLADVFARFALPADAPLYAAQVRKAHRVRRLQELAVGISQRAMSDDPDPDRIIDWVREAIDIPGGSLDDVRHIAQVLPDVIDEIEKGVPPGLSSPWFDVNRLLNGIAPSRFYLFAARPGVGKSLALQNLAVHWAGRHKQNVLFMSLEMEDSEISKRMLAQLSEIELNTLNDAQLNDSQWQRLGRAATDLAGRGIYLSVTAGQTMEAIRTKARDIHRRHGLGLLVVDYLQLVEPRNRRAPRHEQVGEISRGLKLLAKDLGIPVVAAAQLRRFDGEDREPRLSDLRESGSLEQDADAVILLHIPDRDVEWEGEMIIAKARNGTRGKVPVYLETKYAAIHNDRKG